MTLTNEGALKRSEPTPQGMRLRRGCSRPRRRAAARRFNQLDSYVWRRLRALRVQRQGRNLRAGQAEQWTRDFFVDLGLHRLRGTVRYPGAA